MRKLVVNHLKYDVNKFQGELEKLEGEICVLSCEFKEDMRKIDETN